MKTKKQPLTNYQITIGYKAVITVDVKAASEQEASKIALEIFNKTRKFKFRHVGLMDDNYKVDGVLDMDRTWNMYNK